jgi:hypothetical protein
MPSFTPRHSYAPLVACWPPPGTPPRAAASAPAVRWPRGRSAAARRPLYLLHAPGQPKEMEADGWGVWISRVDGVLQGLAERLFVVTLLALSRVEVAPNPSKPPQISLFLGVSGCSSPPATDDASASPGGRGSNMVMEATAADAAAAAKCHAVERPARPPPTMVTCIPVCVINK